MNETNNQLGAHYIENALKNFRGIKDLADRAMRQVDDEGFFHTLDPESNSIAIVVKHMAGNMRSRWTDFLTTDGEKPDRQRDTEFIIEPGDDRAALQERWERGWRCVFGALEALAPADLMRTVTIRGEPHTVVAAINRQLAHYGQHMGQIITLAKHIKSADWQTLSIPRRKSADFNEEMRQKHARD